VSPRPSAGPRMRPAFSSSASTRPANSVCGPSEPAHHRSSCLRFQHSAPNLGDSQILVCPAAIQATSASDGTGVILPMMSVSRRYRLTDRLRVRPDRAGQIQTCAHQRRTAQRIEVRTTATFHRRILPFLGGSPAMEPRTVSRIRTASGSLSANLLASTGSVCGPFQDQEPRTGPFRARSGASDSCPARVHRSSLYPII
jgi:hypothetical protein